MPNQFPQTSSHQSASRRTLVLPVRWEVTNFAVVPAEAVDTRFDENEAELAILVFAIALEMFPDGDGLMECTLD